MIRQVGAASTSVRDLLAEPVRRGVVRHVGRRRLGIEVAGRLLVLETGPSEHTLPCAVIVPGLEPCAMARAGDVVAVGDAALRTPAAHVVIVRWWDPPRVRPGVAPPGLVPPADVDEALGPTVRAALGDAARALLAGHDGVARALLVSVLGRGEGSTPDADDAVAGLLLAARAHLPAARTRALEDVARQVAEAAAERTTLLSVELLRAAATGAAAPVVVRHVLRPDGTTRAAVLRLGATSGAATLAGADVLAQALHELGGRRRTELAA